jgi:hypothetical protein
VRCLGAMVMAMSVPTATPIALPVWFLRLSLGKLFLKVLEAHGRL